MIETLEVFAVRSMICSATFVLLVVVIAWPPVRGKRLWAVAAALMLVASISQAIIDVLIWSHGQRSFAEISTLSLWRAVAGVSYMAGWLLLVAGSFRLRRALQSSTSVANAPSAPASPSEPERRPSLQAARPNDSEFVITLAQQGAALNFDGPEEKPCARLRNQVQKRLANAGIRVAWQDELSKSSAVVRVVQIDQGSQWLRWTCPFIAPAIFEVEGEFQLDGSTRDAFHFARRADISLFGGTGHYMVGVCAERLGNDLAAFFLNRLRPPACSANGRRIPS